MAASITTPAGVGGTVDSKTLLVLGGIIVVLLAFIYLLPSILNNALAGAGSGVGSGVGSAVSGAASGVSQGLQTLTSGIGNLWSDLTGETFGNQTTDIYNYFAGLGESN